MEGDILDGIDPRRLGKELQRARVRRGLTQADAANIIDVARTTLTAIEKGERRIKVDELIKLTNAYGRQVSDFVRSRPQVEPFQVQFRGLHLREIGDEAQIKEHIDRLEELARNYLELEQITNTPLVHRYPPEYDISKIKPDLAAEDIANQERKRLGLGDAPIPNLREILEQDVGLRIFYMPITPSNCSSIYLYDHELGGCIAVNRLHPEERRRWSLAHDYGHFLSQRYRPSLFIEDRYQRVPESERFADFFASHFLTPSSGLTIRFHNLRRSKDRLTIADLFTLAHYYGVSVAILMLRLEDMRLIPADAWDRFMQGGFKVREAQQQLERATSPAHNSQLSIRYQYLAVDAFDQGLISEGQLARFLLADRLEARSIAERLRQYRSGPSESIELNLAQSLDF